MTPCRNHLDNLLCVFRLFAQKFPIVYVVSITIQFQPKKINFLSVILNLAFRKVKFATIVLF
jgi:hypothetical protein